MNISPDFQLEGFERFNYKGGVRFIRRWKAALPDELFVSRTSVNRYHYCACGTAFMTSGVASSLEALERICKEFFDL